MATRIVLADDHKLVRSGIRAILEKVSSISIIAEADDGLEAVEMTLQHLPDLLLVDVTMPHLNGVEVVRQVHQRAPTVRILALSMRADPSTVTEMLQAGAHGYLLKSSSPQELTRAIDAVMRGGTYMSPQVATSIVDHHVRGQPGVSPTAFSLLTPREREVLQLIAEGKTSKEAGKLLHISSKTVETHRAQIAVKLGIKTLAELTKYAIREGLTSLEQ